MAAVLQGANVTAQWYEPAYLGALFPRLEKAVIHTTETKSWPGYSGGASAPNVTYNPALRQFRQHFSNNRSARALRDPADTAVRENRDNVWQLEIVAYSDKRLGDSVGGLWIGSLTDAHFTDLAWAMIQLNADHGLPLVSTVPWRVGATSYYGGVRLSGPEYDAYRGILGHIHVSGNTHWDPGGFDAPRLMAKIATLNTGTRPPGGDDDMPTPNELWMAPVHDVPGTHAGGWLTQAHNAALAARRSSEANAAELKALRADVAALAEAVAKLAGQPQPDPEPDPKAPGPSAKP